MPDSRVPRNARRAVLWVAAALAGNYITAALSAGTGLVVATIVTMGVGWGLPYAIPFFLGVALVAAGLTGAGARLLLPAHWFSGAPAQTIPPTAQESDLDGLIAGLDDVEIYILRTRREAESRARWNRDMVLGPFSPPPPGTAGRSGPFPNEDVRRGYERLRHSGLIERESYEPETAAARYRRTALGEAVAARL